MICSLDEKDFCSVHGVEHSGPMRELALDPGPEGEAHRAHWDKQLGRREVKRTINTSKPNVSINELEAKRRRCQELKQAGKPCNEFSKLG